MKWEMGRDVLRKEKQKMDIMGKNEMILPTFWNFARVLFVVQNNKSWKQDTQLSSLKCLNIRLKNECKDFKEGEKEAKLIYHLLSW